MEIAAAVAILVAVANQNNHSPAEGIVVNRRNFAVLVDRLRFHSDREKADCTAGCHYTDPSMAGYRCCCSYGSVADWRVAGSLLTAGEKWEWEEVRVDAAMMTVAVGYVYLRNTYPKTMLRGNHNGHVLTHQAL